MSACWLTSSPSITGRIGLPSTTMNVNAARACSKNEVVTPFASGPSESASEFPAGDDEEVLGIRGTHGLAHLELRLRHSLTPGPRGNPKIRWIDGLRKSKSTSKVRSPCGQAVSPTGRPAWSCPLPERRWTPAARARAPPSLRRNSLAAMESTACSREFSRLRMALWRSRPAANQHLPGQPRQGANHGQPESPERSTSEPIRCLRTSHHKIRKTAPKKPPHARHCHVREAWFAAGNLGSFGTLNLGDAGIQRTRL